MKHLLLIAVFALVLASCKTAPKAPTAQAPVPAEAQKGIFTSKGELLAEIPATQAQVNAALQSAFAEEGFKISSTKSIDEGGSLISAWPIDTTPDLQQSYRVRLTPKGSSTLISIRFGRFGHEPASRRLLKAIVEETKSAPTK